MNFSGSRRTIRALDDAMATKDLFVALLVRADELPRAIIQEITRLAGGIDWSLRQVFRDVERGQTRHAFRGGIGQQLAAQLGAREDALGPLFAKLMVLPVAAKIAVSLILIAPLAFCMGMPFPLALSYVGRHGPDLIPWAWGVNGCASVLSAILASLGAIHLGFSRVVMMAVGFYLLACLTFPRQTNG